jgi:MtrB/PioB family decaheme-associated outer membrane protein
MKAYTLFAALLAGLSASLSAQTPVATSPPAGVVVSGSVSAGARLVDNDSKSSKLTEYRDLDDQVFLPGVTVNLMDRRNGRFIDAGAVNAGLRDQSFFARGGVAGRWHAAFDWAEIPHNFSNKARTPYTQTSPGRFEVSSHVPITFKKLATAAADREGVLASDELIAAYALSALRPLALHTDTSSGRLSFAYSGWDALGVAMAYDRRAQSGLESTFGPIGDRPPRTLNIQVAEPIDSLTQELTLSAGRVTPNYSLQVTYLFSDFANNVDTLIWENIYTTAAADATYDRWDRAVSTFGRRPLEPDNRYHNASVTLGRDLARNGRLNATLAYGRLEQNAALLPYSFNADLVNRDLPRPTALANIDTFQALFDYAVNPLPKVNVRAWARYYGLDNNTPEANWDYVTSDTSNLTGTSSYKNRRVNLAYASDRTNAGVEATYRLRPWRSSVGARYELESASRAYRESDTTEHRLAFSYTARPVQGVNVKGRYLFGTRGGSYDPHVTKASYWYAPADAGTDADNPKFAFSNHPDMRRFDVADRRRHQADLIVGVTRGDKVSLSGSVRYRGDDFDSGVVAVQPLAGTSFPGAAELTPGGQLGLLEDSRTRYALDAFYLPIDRASFNAFVAVDRGRSLQRGLEFNENNKTNPGVVQNAELGPWTRASSQWTADTDDRVVTSGIGGRFTVLEDRLMLNASYTLSASNMDIAYAGFGVTNWDGTPYPPNHQFAFSSPPRVSQDWHVTDLRAELPLFGRTVLTVGYTFERFRIDDWQQSGSAPWVEPVGSEFLLRDTSRSHQWGNRLFNFGTYLAPSYDAHIGYASLTYRF